MPTEDKSSRRDLLKRALIVLGVGALVQPNGGVSGSAFAIDPDKASIPLRKVSKSGSKPDKPFAKTGSRRGAKSGSSNADKTPGDYAKTPQ